MSAENDSNSTETTDERTWSQTVRDFEAAATWLTPADSPSLKAMHSIAAALDAGTFQAALISQFTQIHRSLLARKGGDAAGSTGEPDLLDMLEKNPGVMWRG